LVVPKSKKKKKVNSESTRTSEKKRGVSRAEGKKEETSLATLSGGEATASVLLRKKKGKKNLHRRGIGQYNQKEGKKKRRGPCGKGEKGVIFPTPNPLEGQRQGCQAGEDGGKKWLVISERGPKERTCEKKAREKTAFVKKGGVTCFDREKEKRSKQRQSSQGKEGGCWSLCIWGGHPGTDHWEPCWLAYWSGEKKGISWFGRGGKALNSTAEKDYDSPRKKKKIRWMTVRQICGGKKWVGKGKGLSMGVGRRERKHESLSRKKVA